MTYFNRGWAAGLVLVLLLMLQPAWPDMPSDRFARGRSALEQGDTNQALSEIFTILEGQQKALDQLMRRSQDQQKIMQEQKELINNQKHELEQQRRLIEEQQTTLAQSPRVPEGFADNYSADKQYEVAYGLQHIAIFDVRRKDAPPYFEKAAEEFAKVVQQYPTAEKADDAQYRIAKIYHRYLKDYSKARQEYQYLLENYPESEYVEEAREALSDLP